MEWIPQILAIMILLNVFLSFFVGYLGLKLIQNMKEFHERAERRLGETSKVKENALREVINDKETELKQLRKDMFELYRQAIGE